jgi:RHS repeat-associated protein
VHQNERGSVVGVTNDAAATIAVNTYDEYGTPGSNNSGRFAFTGQAWLPQIGMYYYKARMYSPKLGRFMQVDPLGYADGVNLYGYVRGDPLNNTDPSGLQTGSIFPTGDGSCVSDISCKGSNTPSGASVAAFGLTMMRLSAAAAAGDGIAIGALSVCRTYPVQCAAAAAIAISMMTSGSNSGDSSPPMAGASESTPMGPENDPNNRDGKNKASTAAAASGNIDRQAVVDSVTAPSGRMYFSATTARHLETTRQYISNLSIRETILHGTRIPDPQGVAGQFMYRIGASYRNGSGTLEVLVDEVNGVINHVNYMSF